MPKRIDITDDIKAKVIANMGSEPTWEQIAVFEMTAVTSLPLSKKWSIFDQAQITAQTFEDWTAPSSFGCDLYSPTAKTPETAPEEW